MNKESEDLRIAISTFTSTYCHVSISTYASPSNVIISDFGDCPISMDGGQVPALERVAGENACLILVGPGKEPRYAPPSNSNARHTFFAFN